MLLANPNDWLCWSYLKGSTMCSIVPSVLESSLQPTPAFSSGYSKYIITIISLRAKLSAVWNLAVVFLIERNSGFCKSSNRWKSELGETLFSSTDSYSCHVCISWTALAFLASALAQSFFLSQKRPLLCCGHRDNSMPFQDAGTRDMFVAEARYAYPVSCCTDVFIWTTDTDRAIARTNGMIHPRTCQANVSAAPIEIRWHLNQNKNTPSRSTVARNT